MSECIDLQKANFVFPETSADILNGTLRHCSIYSICLEPHSLRSFYLILGVPKYRGAYIRNAYPRKAYNFGVEHKA